jgi:predicted nucleic acid-binding protein
MVVLDAATLLLLVRPDVGVPLDSNGKPVSHARERLAHLVKQLEKSRTKILVPTPALSEVLVRAGNKAAQIAQVLQNASVVEIAPFDTMAAVEVAMMTREAIDAGDKRGGVDGTWAKVKYDRQIVAIAKVKGAHTIYTDDGDIRKFAATAGIVVTGIADLPLPPESAQMEMPLAPPPSEADEIEEDASADDEDEEDEEDEEPEPPYDADPEVPEAGPGIGSDGPEGLRVGAEAPSAPPAQAAQDVSAERIAEKPDDPRKAG